MFLLSCSFLVNISKKTNAFLYLNRQSNALATLTSHTVCDSHSIHIQQIVGCINQGIKTKENWPKMFQRARTSNVLCEGQNVRSSKWMSPPQLAFCVGHWGQRVAVICVGCLVRSADPQRHWSVAVSYTTSPGRAVEAERGLFWRLIDSNKLHPERLHADTFFTRSASSEPENASAINRCARRARMHKRTDVHTWMCRLGFSFQSH